MGFDTYNEKRSYDPGWLIQNEQINDTDLCRVLLAEYGQNLYLLARAFGPPLSLEGRSDWAYIVDRTLVSILTGRSAYKNDLPGRVWLYTQIIQASPFMKGLRRTSSAYFKQLHGAFQLHLPPENHLSTLLRTLSQEPAQALVVFFQAALDLSPEEISAITRLPLPQVENLCADFQRKLHEHRYGCPECIQQSLGQNDLQTAFTQALRNLPELPEFAEANLPVWSASIAQRAAAQHSKHQTRLHLFQFAQAGALTVLILVLGWAATRPALGAQAVPLTPTAKAQRIAPGGSSDYDRYNKLLDTASAPTPTPKTDPNGLTPELALILNLARNNQSHWHTIWADVEVTYNSSPANSYLVSTTRTQVWIEQPARARVIYGMAASGPSITYAINDHTLAGQSFQNGETFSQLTDELITDPDLKTLLDPAQLFHPDGQFKLIGNDTVAGHLTWVVDWHSAGFQMTRYWIDVQHGVILRRMEFGGDGSNGATSETLARSITYDASFSDGLFQPGRYPGSFFAKDFSGAPDLSDSILALSSWKPTSTSQMRPADPAQPSINTPVLQFQNNPTNSGVAVFSGQRFLGQLPMGGNAIQSCQLSPNGSKIAYNFVANSPTGNTSLYEASLSALPLAHAVLPSGITLGDYAFAPDNRRLAFFGCDKASGFCGIFILDTLTGKLTHLAAVTYADYLLWKPDGTQLAFVASVDSSAILAEKTKDNMLLNEIYALSQTWHFYVVSASSGNITYDRAFEWLTLTAPPDSPTNTWNPSFKPYNSNLTACATTPG